MLAYETDGPEIAGLEENRKYMSMTMFIHLLENGRSALADLSAGTDGQQNRERLTQLVSGLTIGYDKDFGEAQLAAGAFSYEELTFLTSRCQIIRKAFGLPAVQHCDQAAHDEAISVIRHLAEGLTSLAAEHQDPDQSAADELAVMLDTIEQAIEDMVETGEL